MKTTIYELLGMIKDNNIPQRIIFKGQIYEYVETAEDYYNEEHGYIFDVYILKSILNDEVEILETEITLKQFSERVDEIYNGYIDYVYNKLEDKKIEKLDIYKNLGNKLLDIQDKINEIIEVLNER